MKRIPLDQARPGMILAQKMVRDDGVLLCQKGTELTEALLRMLQRMNYETVPIEFVSSESPEEKQARLSKLEAELDARFVRVENDPILVELKNALLRKLREDE
ncbi:MAG: hypothetical protein KKB20_19955 [Proteobacteria bacterium]|nr:hypothetical protein [Pseudomonadota bacterium]